MCGVTGVDAALLGVNVTERWLLDRIRKIFRDDDQSNTSLGKWWYLTVRHESGKTIAPTDLLHSRRSAELYHFPKVVWDWWQSPSIFLNLPSSRYAVTFPVIKMGVYADTFEISLPIDSRGEGTLALRMAVTTPRLNAPPTSWEWGNSMVSNCVKPFFKVLPEGFNSQIFHVHPVWNLSQKKKILNSSKNLFCESSPLNHP